MEWLFAKANIDGSATSDDATPKHIQLPGESTFDTVNSFHAGKPNVIPKPVQIMVPVL
jgi:hypothetical protein